MKKTLKAVIGGLAGIVAAGAMPSKAYTQEVLQPNVAIVTYENIVPGGIAVVNNNVVVGTRRDQSIVDYFDANLNHTRDELYSVGSSSDAGTSITGGLLVEQNGEVGDFDAIQSYSLGTNVRAIGNMYTAADGSKMLPVIVGEGSGDFDSNFFYLYNLSNNTRRAVFSIGGNPIVGATSYVSEDPNPAVKGTISWITTDSQGNLRHILTEADLSLTQQINTMVFNTPGVTFTAADTAYAPKVPFTNGQTQPVLYLNGSIDNIDMIGLAGTYNADAAIRAYKGLPPVDAPEPEQPSRLEEMVEKLNNVNKPLMDELTRLASLRRPTLANFAEMLQLFAGTELIDYATERLIDAESNQNNLSTYRANLVAAYTALTAGTGILNSQDGNTRDRVYMPLESERSALVEIYNELPRR